MKPARQQNRSRLRRAIHRRRHLVLDRVRKDHGAVRPQRRRQIDRAESAARLIQTSSGSIELGGERIEKLSIDGRLDRGLRLLPEGRGVFPELTVAENLAVVSSVNEGREPMKITSSDVLELFPVLAERRSTLAGSMSGGQQQMLAVGLAILGSPKCLLLESRRSGCSPIWLSTCSRRFRKSAKHTTFRQS